jgi:threonine/homoserine/homoserine lactone efflux protein
MPIESTLAFAVTFFLLAVTPGAGLAMILSRTLGAGMAAGFAVTTGLILGDFAFLAMAIVGLTAMASAMGPLFQVVKYIAAAYLLWLGYRALAQAAHSSAPITLTTSTPTPASARPLWRDVAVGLLVTLGNPKPLLFYGALLPSLMDVRQIGSADLVLLGAVVVVISYPVYGVYMALVERARRLLISQRAVKRLHQATGTMFIISGALVATR